MLQILPVQWHLYLYTSFLNVQEFDGIIIIIILMYFEEFVFVFYTITIKLE